MEQVRLVLKLAHFISWAALFGGVLTLSGATEKKLAASAVWGARLAFVTGLLLIGIKEMLAKSPGADPVNHMKIGIKLLLGLAVVGMIEASRKKGLSGGMHTGVVAVSLLAIAVAVFMK
ncbi:hypothetical protein [Armatimonas sp.]|uniref:hypothetical protein n=1 Tax=Armatimonas sp. TaxID=1872638 RepID=UPI00286A6091|nr:hypothetical protein [Armatimonas sp.]